MISDNAPRKHHYIPQFWSKNWTRVDGRAQRFTMPYRRILVSERKPPSAIGWQRNLYEVPTYERQSIDFETAYFREIDQRASNLFDHLKNSKADQFSPQEFDDLATFLVSMLHRSPAALRSLQVATPKTAQRLIKELEPRYQKVRGPNDPATYEEFYYKRDRAADHQHLSSVLTTLLLSKRLSSFISRLHWHLVELVSSRHELLLSDDPLVRTNGVAKEDGHLALPLTPRLALIGTFKEEFFHEIRQMQPTELAKALNTQAVESARSFVLATDNRQSRFIGNHFGLLPRPTLTEQSISKAGDIPF